MIKNGVTRCRYSIQEVESLEGITPINSILTTNKEYYKVRQSIWDKFGHQAYVVYCKRAFVSLHRND